MKSMYSHIFKRYQGFVIPLVMSFCAIGAITLGLKPAILRTLALYESIKETKAAIATLNEKIQFLENLDESSVQNQLSSLVSAVPISKSPETAIMTLEGAANQSTITLGDLALSVSGIVASDSGEVNQASAKPQIPQFGINFKAYGTTEQLLGFMSLLARSRRLLRLQQYQISLDKSPTELTGTLEAYYLPLKSAPRGESTPLKPLTEAELNLINQISNMPIFIREIQSTAVTFEPKPDPFASALSTP